jgi:hypothetical protein
MSEYETQKLLQEYSERNIRWADRTSSQMSFYNNLLLTLGIGFLSFAYQDSKVLSLEFSLKDIDWSLTTYALSILTVMFSVIAGFVASISRLYDFRITSRVNLIRKRVFEHSNLKIDERTPKEFSFWQNMGLFYKLLFEKYPRITLEQCKAWKNDEENLNMKFIELRTLSYNLGLRTWNRVKWQTFLLMIAVILYAVSILLS